MIQMKYMLAVFQKRTFYCNIPSKYSQEKCLNIDFLTGVQGVQKKCMFEVEISSISIQMDTEYFGVLVLYV